MKRSTYIKYMSTLEKMKRKGNVRSKYKVVRAFHHYLYNIIGRMENYIIRIIDENECWLPSKTTNQLRIVASMTTFPARIEEVKYAIKSIMLQTMKPDIIVLWLADSQFPNNEIPDCLLSLVGHGLVVRFCEDLRSHKKYFFSLQEQGSSEIVITFDDDIIYHPHTIERLVKKHNEYPEAIVCSSAHIISFEEDGQTAPYNRWNVTVDNCGTPSPLYSPLTGSGCLYPYKGLNNEAFNKDIIRRCALSADDLWILMMCKLSKRMVCVPDVVARTFTVVSNTQQQHLGQVNCIGDGNDRTIKCLEKEYGQLFSFLH